MTLHEAEAILAALTPAQRHGFAFWSSIVTALLEASEPVEEPVS